MSIRQVSVLFVIITVLLMAVYVIAEEILTNETVVSMVKAKFGEKLIISKIKSSKNKFDVSMGGMMKLKKEGVTEDIITAMVEASKPSSPEKKPISSPAVVLQTDKVEVLQDDKWVELGTTKLEHFNPGRNILKQIFSEGWGKNEMGRYTNGAHSKFRLIDKKPTFRITTMSRQWEEVKFIKVDVHERKNIRWFKVIQRGLTSSEYILVKGYEVEFDSKIIENGLEITPKNPLEPGEYIITTLAFFMNGFDFGIDGEITGTQKSDAVSKQEKE